MIKKLIEIGLSKYEAEAYYTLVKAGPLSAGDISKKSSIPQGRIYNVLDKLQQRGYCSISLGKIKTYEAANPKYVFDDLIKRRHEEIEQLKTTQQELEELYQAESNENPADFLQLLTSKQSQVEKFDDIIKLSNKTLYSFNKKPYATGFDREKEEIKNASLPLIQTLKRGTSVRAMFEGETGSNQEAFIEMVRYYESLGEEVRICDELPLKMLLADNAIAMISLRNSANGTFKLTSMVVEHSDLTNALDQLFESFWAKGKTINEYYKL